MVFRGKLASASLKQGIKRMFTPPSNLRIPRQACLGLIEAPSSFMKSVKLFFLVFRGKLASASLKLCDCKTTPSCSAPGIPRQACLGLIEASSLSFPSRTMPTVFRGKLASASLKHHLLRVQAGRLLRGIPRQACLGLIEAKPSPSRRPRPQRSYSEASLPRPH